MEAINKLKITPDVSVVMSVFNGEKYLHAAIESILNQSFDNFEFIIINDASLDNTREIILSYTDERIILLENTVNLGVASSPNKAIKIARGKYIARMDCDDISDPKRLALQYEFLENNPDVVAVGSAANFIDVDGSLICRYFPNNEDYEIRSSYPDSPFIHPTVMYRLDSFNLVGQYSEKMSLGGEDAVLFWRLSKVGKLYNIDSPLLNYRLVPGSMSRKSTTFKTLLSKIIQLQIRGDFVSNQMYTDLQQEAKQIDISNIFYNYHLEVAKLYIWSGGCKHKSFQHLNKCISNRYLTIRLLFIYMLALMPKKLMTSIYFVVKKRRYEAISGTC